MLKFFRKISCAHPNNSSATMGAGASIDDDSIRVAITIYEESRTTLKSNSEILVDLKTALGIPTPSLSLMPLAMAAISELAASHILSKSLLNNNHANSNSLVPAPNDTSMITEPPFDLSSMLPPRASPSKSPIARQSTRTNLNLRLFRPFT